MKRITWTVAVTAAIGFASASLPAYAATSCARDFALAKVTHQGIATHSISGSGTVTIQVLVKADGTHAVQRVIRSTNTNDNDAAVDIANTSSYKAAECGTTPLLSFYDFVLKFDGSNATTTSVNTMGGSAADGRIESLVRGGKYDAAIAMAKTVLGQTPGDSRAQQLLGVSDYYANNVMDAAQAFYKVSSVGPNFQAIAAQSLAAAAVQMSSSDSATSLAYAKRAASLANNVNSQFALGVAEAADPTTVSTGIATLQAVRSKVATDPKATAKYKLAIDGRLLNAYLASNDMANAAAMATEMKQIDPSDQVGAKLMGNHYLTLGIAQVNAKNYAAAVPLFDQAAAIDNPEVRVTAYAQAAFALVNDQKDSDLPQAQAYAQKALAIDPDDGFSNFAAGYATTYVWLGSHKDADKAAAMSYLDKADAAAKKASNAHLVTMIEGFQAQQFPSGASK